MLRKRWLRRARLLTIALTVILTCSAIFCETIGGFIVVDNCVYRPVRISEWQFRLGPAWSTDEYLTRRYGMVEVEQGGGGPSPPPYFDLYFKLGGNKLDR